jgi:hypothetical protein
MTLPGDRKQIARHVRNKTQRKELVDRFEDPTGDFHLAHLVDTWRNALMCRVRTRCISTSRWPAGRAGSSLRGPGFSMSPFRGRPKAADPGHPTAARMGLFRVTTEVFLETRSVSCEIAIFLSCCVMT